MKTLLFVAALLAAPAFAGEEQLGIIISGAGADTTNGSTATPFIVPEGSKLTLNCTAAAYICVDTASACVAPGSVSTGAGVPAAALVNFPTSVNQVRRVTITITSKPSSVIRIVGPAAVSCTVWARNGNE